MTTQWELTKDKRDKNRIVKNTVSKGTVGRKEQKEIKNEKEALTGDTGGTGGPRKWPQPQRWSSDNRSLNLATT